MRTVLILALAGLVTACVSVPLTALDDDAFVARVDASVPLPQGALPPESYRRYYAVEAIDVGRALTGIWIGPALAHDDDTPGLYRVAPNDLPDVISHGGCAAVVRVTFDPVRSAITAECDPDWSPPVRSPAG